MDFAEIMFQQVKIQKIVGATMAFIVRNKVIPMIAVIWN